MPDFSEPSEAESEPRWTDVLMILRKTCPLIAGVLENSKGFISGEYLLIDTDNSQFRTLVNGQNAAYRNSIRNAAKEVFGKTFKLGPYKKAEQVKNSSDPLLELQKKLEELKNK